MTYDPSPTSGECLVNVHDRAADSPAAMARVLETAYPFDLAPLTICSSIQA